MTKPHFRFLPLCLRAFVVNPCSLLFVLLVFSSVVTVSAAPLQYFVATDGNDSNPGTAALPFATLEAARDAIRTATGRQTAAWTSVPATWEGAEVILRGGTYYLKQTLTLDARDSGAEGKPITYRSADNERATLSGGVPIPTDAWKPVTDPTMRARLQPQVRDLVREVDLAKLGIKDLGKIGELGKRMELFADGAPMQLARWPNKGWAHIDATVGPTVVERHGRIGCVEAQFTMKEDRLQRWGDPSRMWLLGYWFWNWSDETQRIDQVDRGTGVISLAGIPHRYGYRPDQTFVALNAIEELDQSGEWVLMERTGRVLFQPSNINVAAQLSMLTSALYFDNVCNVTLSRFVVECTRSTTVVVNESKWVVFDADQIRNTGGWGVRITAGSDVTIKDSSILSCGEGGIFASGGDRATLTGGGHTILRCDISDFGRIRRTYRPGVELDGVGLQVLECRFTNSPHFAILFRGNDHRIAGCVFERICQETGDAGAIYSGRNWTWRGTVIEENTFQDVGGSIGTPAAVYLDDQISGTIVRNNRFLRCPVGVLINGGRENVMLGNEFSDCPIPVLLNPSGVTSPIDKLYYDGLDEVPYRNELWEQRYPTLATLLESQPGAPIGNVIKDNRLVDGRWLLDARAPSQEYLDLEQQNFDASGMRTALRLQIKQNLN